MRVESQQPSKRRKQQQDDSKKWEALVAEEMMPELANHRSLLCSVEYHPHWEKPNGPYPKFIQYARYYPDLYRKLLGCLGLGCSVIVACNLLGITYPTFSRWINQGRFDESCGEDTYYSRFFSDIWWALAICAARCEMRVTSRDPKEWLTRGMGKAMFTGTDLWEGKQPMLAVDEEGQRLLSDIEAIPDTFLEDEDSDIGVEEPMVQEGDVVKALEELKQQGILQIDQGFLDKAKGHYLPSPDEDDSQ